MATTRPPAKHLVVEMRYAASLAFYGIMDKIGISLADGHSDWERTALSLEVRDAKRHRRCFLAHSRSFYESVDFPVEEPEFEQAFKLFDKLHHELKFTTVQRIGIRQWVSVPATESFAQLVKKVVEKLHLRSDRIDQILRGKVEDIGYVADVRTDVGWKYHLRLGPMERKQWFETILYTPALFSSPEDFKKYQDSLPERMYFLDLDGFREEFPFSDLPSLLASIRQGSSDILADLIAYLRV
jgi:hypothetical protein